MATEQILDGQYFRRLKDATNNVWERLSFWTKAKDVYFEDGSNLETKIASLASSNGAITIDTTKVVNDYNNGGGTTYIMQSGLYCFFPFREVFLEDLHDWDGKIKITNSSDTSLNVNVSLHNPFEFRIATYQDLHHNNIAIPNYTGISNSTFYIFAVRPLAWASWIYSDNISIIISKGDSGA